ncbi:ParB family protein [Vibrio lentus]
MKRIVVHRKLKERNFSYEVGRLSGELQPELDLAIQEVLKKK